MFNKIILVTILLFGAHAGKAQSADAIYNSYLNFNLARLQGEGSRALTLGEALLPNADKLPEKAQENFYYRLGNLFENNNEPDKALPCYEKVAAAVPNYYVARRAIGYLYVKRANRIGLQLNAAKANINENKRLTALYNAEVKKALPHLEKAQACDPNDASLVLINRLYKNTKNEAALSSLNTRLKSLSTTCIDLLDEK